MDKYWPDDVNRLLELYGRDKSPEARQTARKVLLEHWPNVNRRRASFVANLLFQAWGHRFLYDRATLQHLREVAEFRSVVLCGPGESSDFHLSGIEAHGKMMGDEINRFETMILEGTKGDG